MMLPRESILAQKFKSFPPLRILITGSNGMLGQAFQEALRLWSPATDVRALSHEDLDVCDREKTLLQAGWLSEKPSWIIHCAALVNVERCAQEPELARKIIVGGTQNILDLAASARAQVFYPQSFLIFSAGNALAEDTPADPMSVYGKLKLEAEQLVLRQSANNLVVRMAGFFGGEQRDKNFVGKIVPHLHKMILENVKSSARQKLSYKVGDRVWQPTYTLDLAANSLCLIGAAHRGVFHMACHGEASFFELAQALVECLGWQHEIEIVPVANSEVSANEIARPLRAILQCNRLQEIHLDLQRPWQTALAEYLARPYFNYFKTFQRKNHESLVT